MTMTNDEIVRDYKAAKTPAKQIAVLADLNVCTKKEIVEILREAGCEPPAYYTKKPKQEKTLEEKIENVQDKILSLGLQYTGSAGATGGSGRHAEPVVIIPEDPAQDQKIYIAPETLTALTKAKVAFSDAVRAMLPEFDGDEDFEDIDKEWFFERVIGMVVMLDALERRERRS